MKAWLMLAKHSRQHGGNLGYDDVVNEYYSWDDTVANHSGPQLKDKIILWDGLSLLGASTIMEIGKSAGLKTRQRCPFCKTTRIKSRKQLLPKYRCHKCRSEFEEPLNEQIQVNKYRSEHRDFWYDMQGLLSGEQLRDLCFQPKSQQSIRPLRWDTFLASIDSEYGRNLGHIDSHLLQSGFKLIKTRARVGQGAFRQKMREKFSDICALSGSNHHAALDAAHLYSYAESGKHDLSGGLLLRKDLHRLFDLGMIAIDTNNNSIVLSEELRTLPQYELYNGARPKVKIDRATEKWLHAHWVEHFGNEKSL